MPDIAETIPASGRPSVVLVHGAGADGSIWNAVVPVLTAKGVQVIVVRNPLGSLADDVAATRRAIEQQPGPVLLVGHDWGGVVVTGAGRDPKVRGLVYVAAFAPDEGESVHALLSPSREKVAAPRDTVGAPAWKELATWYVLAEQDTVIPAAVQQALATRMGSVLTPLDSGHAVPISRPEEVAAIILRAVDEVDLGSPGQELSDME